MQRKYSYSLAVVAVSVLALLAPLATVLAERGQSKVRATATTETAVEVENELKTQKSEAARLRAEVKKTAKLTEAKLKACQNRAKSIQARTDGFVKKAEKHLATFEQIETKVLQFAEDKKIEIENKEALLANIDAKADQVKDDIEKLKSDEEAFSCEGDNPKAQLEAFLAQAKLVRTDLKAYRVAVRELIQAVRHANGQRRGTSGESAETGTGTNNDTNDSSDNTNETSGAQQ